MESMIKSCEKMKFLCKDEIPKIIFRGVEIRLKSENLHPCIKIQLKESLHIVLITIIFLEINQLHSLLYRQMITKEKMSKKIYLRVYLSYKIQQL